MIAKIRAGRYELLGFGVVAEFGEVGLVLGSLLMHHIIHCLLLLLDYLQAWGLR